MKKVYFEYQRVPYVFDLENSRLFRIEGLDLIEVVNRTILRDLRLKSMEIPRREVERFTGE
jgi:hypothetical protein